MSGESREAQYFKVVCDLLVIQTRRLPWYPACPECKKKLLNEGESGFGGGGGDAGNWRCERCNKHFQEPNWTYNLSLKLGDHSDIVYVSLLGEYPATEMIGLKATELRALAERDKDFQGWEAIQDMDLSTLGTVKEQLESRQYRQFHLLIKAKLDDSQYAMSQGTPSIRYNAIKILEKSTKDEAASLLSKLNKYEKM